MRRIALTAATLIALAATPAAAEKAALSEAARVEICSIEIQTRLAQLRSVEESLQLSTKTLRAARSLVKNPNHNIALKELADHNDTTIQQFLVELRQWIAQVDPIGGCSLD